MKKLGLEILVGAMVLALGLSVVVAQGRSINGNDRARVPDPRGTIERGVFVDYGYHSPPWYPQDCSTAQYETDTYRWAPTIYWSSLPIATITVYTGDEPSAVKGESFAAIKAGFQTWGATTSASLYGSIVENATSGPGVVLDGGNTVQWGTIDGPGGIIGATYYWYWLNTKEMIEFDMILDKDEPWSTIGTSTAFDVQNVATHEAGHTLVLRDISSPKDCGLTMHAYTWLGDIIKRDLAPGDALGVKAIYGE